MKQIYLVFGNLLLFICQTFLIFIFFANQYKEGARNSKDTNLNTIDGGLIEKIANDYWKWDENWDK